MQDIYKKVKTNRLYNIWYAMNYRCTNPKHRAYKDYGAKGIKVLFTSFESFVDWSLENGYKANLTIDRINNEESYSPSNCRWVTYKEQENNRTNNTLITYNNETHTIAEWADIFGVNYDLLVTRLTKNNYNFEQAINKPSEKRERLIKYKGKEQNLRQWADELGIPYYCLRSRFNNLHWTVEKAFETPYEGGNKNDN